ncbi:hypothetical protein GVX82_04955 [Patescibacteria group bacterium]|jgi:hypothetical protein|nr:hypothetical protein [Patescibacteria group bacterium]
MTTSRHVSLALLTLIVTGAAFLGTTGYAFEKHCDRPRCGSRINHHAIQHALATRDFARWRELMRDTDLLTYVHDEATFAAFAEAHELLMRGEVAAAEQLFEELGIERPFAGPHHHPHGAGMRLLLELADEDVARLERARALYQAGEQAEAFRILRELREQLGAH